MPVEFAYAQARAQARHGDRLTAESWGLVESGLGLAQYLHLVRGTALAARVQHFSATTSPHAIERSLRSDWRTEVAGAARWVPARWRAAVEWTARLPDLPALDLLAEDASALPWMRSDPVLSPLAIDDPELRRSAMAASPYAPLLEPAAGGEPADAWLRHWRTLWPSDDAGAGPLDALVTLLQRYRRELGAARRGETTADRHRALARLVLRMLRRHREQPVAVFCHLCLTALELHRLRDGLVRRALFNDVAREAGT